MIQQAAREFAQQQCLPGVIERDENQIVPKEQLKQLANLGLLGMMTNPTYGGAGMDTVSYVLAMEEISKVDSSVSVAMSVNNSLVCWGLEEYGSEAQKQKYLTPLAQGIKDEALYIGAFLLSEPEAGSDATHQHTSAVKEGDHYIINGVKNWITNGSTASVYLVIAQTDYTKGHKGINAFIVEKNTPGVSVGAKENKMGIRASATCVMNYDGAKGFLVGEENKGLAGMFVMMNIARLGVGVQGLAQAEGAYQNAVQYAKDRRQGRSLTGVKDSQEKADTLFVHPDIRRMLMEAKAFTEGMRAFCLWGGIQSDLVHKAQTAEERQNADDLLSLLMPVIKGYGTDKGYEVCTNMQQVLGGHGYVEEWGMSQYVRDARIAMIYEGANGIQALDLVGRKLPAHGGRAIQLFFGLVAEEVAAAKGNPATAKIAGALEAALGDLQASTMWLMANAMANPDNAGAGSVAYMHLTGVVAIGLMWLRMATAAQAALDAGTKDSAFMNAKLITARFYAERSLPETISLRRKLEAGAESVMALPVEAFAA